MVNKKETKLPSHWSSKIPKRYKRNVIIGDLHRAKRISTNFPAEVEYIKDKYIRAGYPLRFVHAVVNNFNQSQNELEDFYIIPQNL